MKKILAFMILLVSCHSPVKSKGKIVPNLLNVDGEVIKVTSTFQEDRVLYLDEDMSQTIFVKSLNSANEAKSYAMGRRMLLLRKFEKLVEPYFGTANAKECGDNLTYTPIQHSESGISAVVQLLSKGNERVIHDCLITNNTHWLRVELITCGKTFYDYRSYFPLSFSKPSIALGLKCRDNF